MRRLFLVAALFVLALAVSPARAETPDFLSAEEVTAGGGCTLPDLTGLSEDEQEAALIAAGFEQRSDKAVAAACPTIFKCASLPNCAIGAFCTGSSLGSPCCRIGNRTRCCENGNDIFVLTCSCVCTALPCTAGCVGSDDVSLEC